MNQSFAIIPLSVVPVRAEASDKAEQVTQILFGESVEILEKQERWLKVRCSWDNYEGWIDPKQCIPSNDNNYHLNNQVSVAAINTVFYLNNPMYLSIGSSLPNIDGVNVLIGDRSINFQGKYIVAGANYFENIEVLAKLFLNTPYEWGGRSIFGIDCSGFTQIVYKILGIALLRDANQQAEQGSLVNFVEEAKPGDLAFFDNEEEAIIHVGIVLTNNMIIHASGCVRIDQLDHQGIFNLETKKYSHKLRIIKRLL